MRDRGVIDAVEIEAAYRAVRARTDELCAPLEIEDWVAQSMPDASPVKWHAAHTSWFFEAFVLADAGIGHRSPDPRYAYLFNSYYEAKGARQKRSERGLLTRPTVREVRAYRRHVDDAMARLLDRLARASDDDDVRQTLRVIELGLHHEEQHQELLLTDVKHLFAQNALLPAYRAKTPITPDRPAPPERTRVRFDGGIAETGHDADGFAFDNERPRHRVIVEPFEIASRLVTCGEMRAFIDDHGYRRAELWLADGWDWVRAHDVRAPLYWSADANEASIFTLSGARALDPHEPVCHVSFYEADAFARWAGARLPTEHEWELAATSQPIDGSFADAGTLHPSAPSASRIGALHGETWQWTASAYQPYPGYRAAQGALGEYNGKFMSGQMVLRGSSCLTPRRHARSTYRNFFPPSARWQMTGIRLAHDVARTSERGPR